MKEENKAKKIYKRLTAHYRYVISRGVPADSIIGVFLIGSQNFEMDTEKSDVDSICLVVPTIERLCSHTYKDSKDYHLLNGEIIKVIPITRVPYLLSKGNLSFLQILFTKYRFLRPNYSDLWKEYFDKNEKLIEINRLALIKSSLYVALNLFTDGEQISNKKLSFAIFNYAFATWYACLRNYQKSAENLRTSCMYNIYMNIKNTAEDALPLDYKKLIIEVYNQCTKGLLEDKEWLASFEIKGEDKKKTQNTMYEGIEKILLRFYEKDAKNRLFAQLFNNVKERNASNDTL